MEVPGNRYARVDDVLDGLCDLLVRHVAGIVVLVNGKDAGMIGMPEVRFSNCKINDG